MRYYSDYQHYRSAWQDAFYFAPKIPLNIDIELTTICNLQCPFCFTSNKKFRELQKAPYMDSGLATRIISHASKIGIPSLKFNWRGESTLHPDFTNIMKFAKRHGDFHERLINTNGNCPDHALPGLMYATKVMVSLDTYGKQSYAEMRKCGDLRTVINTVNYLLDRGHDNVWIRRVITETNKNENFVQITKSTFGNKVHIADHYCFTRSDKHDEKREKPRRIYCGYPSQRLVISTDGEVYPCCVDYYGKMLVGNFNNQDIMSIWNSQKLHALRNHIVEQKKMPLTCRNCTSFMSYDMPERDCVEDKDLR